MMTLSGECRYVEQNDIHSPQVTVGESLMFSAQLRLMDVNKRDLKAFVNEVSVCQLGAAHEKWSEKLCKFCLEELLSLHSHSRLHRPGRKPQRCHRSLEVWVSHRSQNPCFILRNACGATGDGPGGADAAAELAGGHPGQHRAQRGAAQAPHHCR